MEKKVRNEELVVEVQTKEVISEDIDAFRRLGISPYIADKLRMISKRLAEKVDLPKDRPSLKDLKFDDTPRELPLMRDHNISPERIREIMMGKD